MPHFLPLKNQSPAYRAAVLALQTLADEGGDVSRAFAEVQSEISFNAFTSNHPNVKRSNSHVCRSIVKNRQHPSDEECDRVPADDHSLVWKQGRRVVGYTSEPYGASLSDLSKLSTLATDAGMTGWVDAGSWHFPSRTILIELWNDTYSKGKMACPQPVKS